MSNEAATLPATIWHRSSYSGGQGDCLELAQDIPALAPVRDSKNPTGPVVPFGRVVWRAFLARLG